MSRARVVPPPTPATDVVRYSLTLFVAGASDRSARAVADAQAFGETHLDGAYELRVLDLLLDADAARAHRVLAAPTLIKVHPPPERRFVGDLSDADRVLVALGLGTDGGAVAP